MDVVEGSASGSVAPASDEVATDEVAAVTDETSADAVPARYQAPEILAKACAPVQ